MAILFLQACFNKEANYWTGMGMLTNMVTEQEKLNQQNVESLNF